MWWMAIGGDCGERSVRIWRKNLLKFKEPVDGHEILVEEGQSAGERRAPKRK